MTFTGQFQRRLGSFSFRCLCCTLCSKHAPDMQNPSFRTLNLNLLVSPANMSDSQSHPDPVPEPCVNSKACTALAARDQAARRRGREVRGGPRGAPRHGLRAARRGAGVRQDGRAAAAGQRRVPSGASGALHQVLGATEVGGLAWGCNYRLLTACGFSHLRLVLPSSGSGKCFCVKQTSFTRVFAGTLPSELPPCDSKRTAVRSIRIACLLALRQLCLGAQLPHGRQLRCQLPLQHCTPSIQFVCAGIDRTRRGV